MTAERSIGSLAHEHFLFCALLQVDRPDVEGPWVALIARSQGMHEDCTFDVKVRHVQSAGAAAAIVYDDTYEVGHGYSLALKLS